ncbi:MAG: hypothetical protein RL684_1278 [Pseudomonadota bacterium]|jgi:hypothetical protein
MDNTFLCANRAVIMGGKETGFMRIAKPLLIVCTPIGVAAGLYEGYRLAGGLVFLMGMLVAFVAAALGSLIYVARRERQAHRGVAGDESR